jgi:hypothetical protein
MMNKISCTEVKPQCNMFTISETVHEMVLKSRTVSTDANESSVLVTKLPGGDVVTSQYSKMTNFLS